MLKLTILGEEYFNEKTETFETVGDIDLEMEHSLVSLSKWESKFKKPFLSNEKKTAQETLYYIEAMIISPIHPSDILFRLSEENMVQINDYIESSESAITFECEYWHLNRLFALIRVCNIKNSKPKKMSRHEIASRNRELNAIRRAQYNTSG